MRMSDKWLIVVLFGSIVLFALLTENQRVPEINSAEKVKTLAEQDPAPRFSPVSIEPLPDQRPAIIDADGSELTAAWAASQVYVRHSGELVFGRGGDEQVRARLERLLAGKRLPTIVYLPGCSLPRWPGPSHFWRQVTRSGFAVIGIDGFARSDWQQLCANKTLLMQALNQQIRFVVQQLKQFDWVDHNNLFLMGYDEGGSAVSAYLGDGFNGIITVAASCTAHVLRPIAPLLAVASEHDASLDDTQNYCHYASERVLIDSVVHGVLVFEDAQQAVHRFLRRHLI
jgi:hypothetical protein